MSTAAGPPTIYTVAERAGVSVATVSRVLQGNPATSQQARESVQRAVAELNYRPLRPRPRRPQTFGLLVPTLTGPEPAALLLGMQADPELAEGQARMLLACEGIGDPADVDEAVVGFAAQTDALVICDDTATDETVATLAAQQPVVLIGREPVAGCDRLDIDQRSPMDELAAGLAKLGRRSAVFVGDPNGNRSLARRYAAFQSALTANGLTEARQPVTVPADASGADVALPDLLDSEYPAEVAVCASDDLALRLLHLLVWRGLQAPADLAVTGWGDQPGASYVVPRLTTVTDPSHRLGRLAADRLRRRLAQRDLAPAELVLTPEVRWRESTGRP